MHIPDGFLSPKTYLPAYGAAAVLWALAIRRVRRTLDEDTLPRLAVLTALAFALMLIMLPLPGGTSVHASGVAILAVTFGPWTCYLAVSLVLLVQALFFGDGGVTSLPVVALALGFCGGGVAWLVWRALRGLNEKAALFAAGWLGTVMAALLTAVALGAQPGLAHAADGAPLFFPFGFDITLPAVVLPHMLMGIGEGLLTVLVCGFFGKLLRERR